jgi:hypothetical protein
MLLCSFGFLVNFLLQANLEKEEEEKELMDNVSVVISAMVT